MFQGVGMKFSLALVEWDAVGLQKRGQGKYTPNVDASILTFSSTQFLST